MKLLWWKVRAWLWRRGLLPWPKASVAGTVVAECSCCKQVKPTRVHHLRNGADLESGWEERLCETCAQMSGAP